MQVVPRRATEYFPPRAYKDVLEFLDQYLAVKTTEKN